MLKTGVRLAGAMLAMTATIMPVSAANAQYLQCVPFARMISGVEAGQIGFARTLPADGFLQHVIDFARALVMRREPNRETIDVTLLLAATAIMIWAWPALGTGDAGLIRGEPHDHQHRQRREERDRRQPRDRGQVPEREQQHVEKRTKRHVQDGHC